MKFTRLSVALLSLIGLAIAGCTAAQLAAASKPTVEANGTTQPAALSPATTQKVEIVLEKGDSFAAGAQTVGNDLVAAGQTGTALGVPYSAWGTVAGGLILTLSGLWMKERGKSTNATQAAVSIATAANNEAPVGLTPALATVIQSIQPAAPDVHAAITAALANSPTVEAPAKS